MKQQTAVEWLEEQIKDIFYVAQSSEMTKRFQDIYAKAKAMEKEQIVHCYEQAYRDGYIDNGKSGEAYYNETYGGDK
jgi:hypothetical protein